METETPNQSRTRIRVVDPATIEIRDRIRTDVGDLNTLASSIAEVGQIHPIRVFEDSGKLILLAGYRRLKACQQLGVNVRAEVSIAGDDYKSLLRQIHENIRRKDFDALEEGEALRRSKILYEAIHPETKLGRTGKGRSKSKISDDAAPRFTLEAAKQMGCSERKAQELIELANLPKATKRLIEQAKSSAERNQIANRCLSDVRAARREEALRKQAESKRQTDIETPPGSRPKIVLHFGDNADYMQGEELYEVILTDPPYDRERSVISHAARASINAKDHAWDKLDVGWVMRAAPLLTKGGHLIVFCPLEAIGSYEVACLAAGLEYRQAMVWVKSNPAPTHRSVYSSAVEALIWAVKPGGKPFFSIEEAKAGGQRTNVFDGAGVSGSAKDRIHETQKPEWLIRRLLEIHASPQLGHRVLDPFAGSCVTGIVARDLGMESTLIERDEDYVRKAKLRIQAR